MSRNRWLTGCLLLAGACGEVTTNGNDNPPPLVESVSPARGGVPGGATITITGSGFMDHDAGENFVVVGMLTASDVEAADDATLTFTLPPGPEPQAKVDVLVFNNNGFGVLTDAIQYNVYPRLSSVSVSHVPSDGGASITVTGEGFQDDDPGENHVTFGGIEASSVTVESDTELTVETPARSDDVGVFELVDVALENANGSAVLPEAVEFTEPGFLLIGNGNNGSGHQLVFIDIDADPVRRITLVSELGFGAASAGIGPDDALYVLGNTRSTGGTRNLYRVDPLTGATSMRGVPDNDNIPGIVDTVRDFAFVDGDLFGMLRTGRQLASIDLDTAIYTPKGAADSYPEVASFGTPIALGKRNATSVWAASTTTAIMRRITTGTSATVDGPTLTSPGGTSVPLYALVERDGELIGLTRYRFTDGNGSAQSIVSINTTTGVVSLIANITGGPWGALTRTPPSF